MGITIKNLTLLGKNDFAKVVGDVLRTLKVTVANREAVTNFTANQSLTVAVLSIGGGEFWA